MNLQNLHGYVEKSFEDIKPAFDQVFNNKFGKTVVNAYNFARKLHIAGKQFRIKVRAVQEKPNHINPELDIPHPEGHFYPTMIGFCYDQPDSGDSSLIEIVLCLSPKTKRLALSFEAWGNFQYRFYQTILHELVHRAQFAQGYHRTCGLIFRTNAAAKADKELMSEQQYIGELDEIEAYARDLVEDWYYHYPGKPLSVRKLGLLFREKDDKLYTIRKYSSAYDGDTNHPAVKRLFRKTKIWNQLVTPLAKSLPSCPIYVRFALRGMTLA
jgi:hypothetical protein